MSVIIEKHLPPVYVADRNALQHFDVLEHLSVNMLSPYRHFRNCPIPVLVELCEQNPKSVHSLLF